MLKNNFGYVDVPRHRAYEVIYCMSDSVLVPPRKILVLISEFISHPQF